MTYPEICHRFWSAFDLWRWNTGNLHRSYSDTTCSSDAYLGAPSLLIWLNQTRSFFRPTHTNPPHASSRNAETMTWTSHVDVFTSF